MDTKINDKSNSSSRYKVNLPFSKVNFYMMGGCVLLIIVGFLLMSGGGSASDAEFNPEIFSTRRIVVGPALTFLGFLFMAFAIIWSPKSKKDSGEKLENEITENTHIQTEE